MGLNDTPFANRVHIGFFGRRNAGKSSLVNAVTGQDMALVSEVKGTTTDPVYKAMELLPMGPVLIIDTPGIDDTGELGELRVRRAKRVLNKTDVAVLVLDAELCAQSLGQRPGAHSAKSPGQTQDAPAKDRPGRTDARAPAGADEALCAAEKELIDIFQAKGVPYIIAVNKSDLLAGDCAGAPGITAGPDGKALPCAALAGSAGDCMLVSAKTGDNIRLLKERIAALAAFEGPQPQLVADLIRPSDFVLLVTPIDKAAPKGRLILPQQQTVRDILDTDATAVVVKEHQLRETLAHLGKKPSLVITDSQVFAKVAAEVPPDIRLTSFSILFARYKGALESSLRGLMMLDKLAAGDKLLIAEGCTHHRQCDDIGTVKLPRWISEYTAREHEFRFCSGGEFPEDLSAYAMVIHCGGCMLNEREMNYRRRCAEDQQVPFSNFGMVIAQTQGILKRSLAVFPRLLAQMND